MEEEKDFEEVYFKSISEIGNVLFTEYLSGESRRRQTYLLLSSVITILLSFALVTPTEISIAGITTNSMDGNLLMVLSGLICLYFITIYVLGILQDLEVYKYRKMPLSLVWRDLSKKFDEAIKQHDEEMKKAKGLFDERMKGREALKKKGDELSARLEAESNDLINTEGFIRVTEHSSFKTLEEFNSLMEEISQTTKQDGVDEALDQQEKIFFQGQPLFRKANSLLDMTAKYNRLNKIKMYIEVGFPIMMGFIGVGSAVYSIIK